MAKRDCYGENYLRSEVATQATISAFAKPSSRVNEGSGEEVGTFFGGFNIGLDVWGRSQAINSTGRVVFSTQLVFNSTSFLLGGR